MIERRAPLVFNSRELLSDHRCGVRVRLVVFKLVMVLKDSQGDASKSTRRAKNAKRELATGGRATPTFFLTWGLNIEMCNKS
jgi:hypothetical protein